MSYHMKKALRIKKAASISIVFLLLVQIIAFGIMAASAASDYVVLITASSVNVRSGAGTNSGKVGTAYLGGEYDLLSEGKDSSGGTWYKVQLNSATTGWIASNYCIKTKRADNYMQVFVDGIGARYGAVGIQVAVIDGGTVGNTYSYGWATKNTDRMTDDHKIRVASISKVAVAINAMKLQEQGIVNINSNIGSYWGSNPYKAVTLKSLLTHTSTLSTALSSSSTRAGTLSQLKSSGSYTGGTVGSSGAWAYNNYAMGVAGSTLEVALGKTLGGYSKENIFAPLGMDASFFSGALDNPSKLATLYHSNGNVARSLSTLQNYKGSSTPGNNATAFAGGLTASAKDIAKLFAMLANDGTYNGVRVLSPESVATIESRLFAKTENGGSFYQCMPLRYKANLYGQSELYYHTGNAYGVLALASYNPATKDGVVVLTTGMSDVNTSPACSRDAQGIYEICGKLTEYAYKYDKPTVPVETVQLDRQSIDMKLGETVALNCTVSPVNATEILQWSSSGKCVSITQSGELTANGYGTAVITANAANGASASCTVTVAPDINLKMLGASIRVSDPYGIRFGIQLDKNEFYKKADIVEYGTLIIGAGTLGSAELTLDTPQIRRIKAEKVLSEDSAKLVYTGVLINIPESFFGTDVTARGYIVYRDADGNERVFYTSTATKNFNAVAQAAYDSYSAIPNPSVSELDILEKLAGLLGINAGEDEQPDDSSLDKPEDNPPVNDESTTPADEGDGKTDAKGDADEGGEDIAATQSTVSTEINPAAAENPAANNITEGNTEQYE